MGLLDPKCYEDISKGTKIKALCPKCQTTKQKTNHEILKSIELRYSYWTEEYRIKKAGIYPAEYSKEYQIIKCLGCETITFRELYRTLEVGQSTAREVLYPKRTFKSLCAKSFPNLPDKILGIYTETLNSYNSENHILCAAGLRAIVESICTHQGIKGGPMEIEKPNSEKVSVRGYLRSLGRGDSFEHQVGHGNINVALAA